MITQLWFGPIRYVFPFSIAPTENNSRTKLVKIFDEFFVGVFFIKTLDILAKIQVMITSSHFELKLVLLHNQCQKQKSQKKPSFLVRKTFDPKYLNTVTETQMGKMFPYTYYAKTSEIVLKKAPS